MAAQGTKTTSPSPQSAFLSSLYIYNPTLGRTDSTVHEQLIFHYSPSQRTPDTSPTTSPVDEATASKELDRQLRAIGLAQGIVEFARAFSPNAPVTEVRTQKGFTVPVEVEKDWWMLATIDIPSPNPADLITPSILCHMLRRAYRIHRLRFRTFNFLLNRHSLEYLKSTITPYYNTFAEKLDLSLSHNSIESDFDAVRWSCLPLNEKILDSLAGRLRRTKVETPKLIDTVLFRAPKENLVHEPRSDGLLFAGVQDGSLSAENIRDLGLWISELEMPTHVEQVDMNGESTGKRSMSLPGLSQSWDSVVQTSSSLFSALSFGTVPAKRSPLATQQELSSKEGKVESMAFTDEGLWVVGGDKETKRIWLEAGEERFVPISLGNQRPGFLQESSSQQSPAEDGLVELELSVYKVELGNASLTLVQ